MKVPLSWLCEYVDPLWPIEELTERLTMAGLQVSGILPFRATWENVLVGEVVEVAPHPSKEHLHIIRVSEGRAVIPTVASASNVQVGDRVPLALPGARYINADDPERREMLLEPAEVHGVWSAGMACSERELHLTDEHEGILVLDPTLPAGLPLAAALPDVVREDTVLELELTPNLGRCLSIIGVAREVAALTGRELKVEPPRMMAEGASIEGQVTVEIAAPDLCSRYCAALIRGVYIGSSPLWMKQRLWLAGVPPLNNIVDITNYVMLEWGQPLHAFDYDRLRGRDGASHPPGIIVRRARPREQMTTLDEKERELTPEMLLITDGGGPVALAGVMGGMESRVMADTTNILLESASFDYINNRHTARELKLESASSLRFSKGLPAALTIPAAIRAAELMRQLGSGVIAQGIIDVYPVPQVPRVIDLITTEVERILGMPLDTGRMVGILTSLGFDCQRAGETLRVTAPDHRLDVSVAADLIEELARVVGYDEIPVTRMREELPPAHRNLSLEGEEQVRDIMASCGLTEVIIYSLTNPRAIAMLTPDGGEVNSEDYIQLGHPLSSERVYLRRTLLAGLLEMARDHLRYVDRARLFEIGRVYEPQGEKLLPKELQRLAILLTGSRVGASWHDKAPEAMDFYDLKGVVEMLLNRLGLEEVMFVPVDHPTFQPGRAAAVRVRGGEVGRLGEVHPLVREAFDLPEQRVCLAELELEKLLAQIATPRLFRPIPRQPPVKEALAFVVHENLPAIRVQEVILEAGGEMVREVFLFDIYRGEPLPSGKKNVAYSLSYQSDRPLTSEDVVSLRERIVRAVEDKLGAMLRA